jgi:hypothetical protein
MPNVYVEARPKGRPEGSAIEDYVVEDHADHVLATVQNTAGGNRLVQKERTRPAGRARAAPERQKETGHWRAA